MKTNLWGKLKKLTALLTVFTQILLPAAGADVVAVEMQNQGIPAIAPEKVIEVESPEVPESAFNAFFSESPLSRAEAVMPSIKPQTSDISVVDESGKVLGEMQYPIEPAAPVFGQARYLVMPTKSGAEASFTFTSLDSAKAFIGAALDSVNSGSSASLTLGDIQGGAFELYGNAILAAYENNGSGVTVYLKNSVKRLDGAVVAEMDWAEKYVTLKSEGHGGIRIVSSGWTDYNEDGSIAAQAMADFALRDGEVGLGSYGVLTFHEGGQIKRASSRIILGIPDGFGVETIPIPMPVPDQSSYFVAGTKAGADASFTFASLDAAKAFIGAGLDSVNSGSSASLTFAKIDGPAFEVYGLTILASYEDNGDGVTVYLANTVKRVGGDAVGLVDWAARFTAEKSAGHHDVHLLFGGTTGFNEDGTVAYEVMPGWAVKDGEVILGSYSLQTFDDAGRLKTRTSMYIAGTPDGYGIEPIPAEPAEMPIGHFSPEATAVNSLVDSLGIDRDQINQWIVDGLVKMNVIRSSFGNFINVEFDASLQGRHIAKSEFNPLGSFAVPSSVFMEFEERESPWVMYPSRLVNISPLPDGENFVEVPMISRIMNMDVKFSYPIEMGEIDGDSIFVQHAAVTFNTAEQVTKVVLRDGLYPSGTVVKEIAYSNLPALCKIGFECPGGADFGMNANPKTATILYPQSQTITKRVAVYNIADIMPSEGMPYGTIRSIRDTDSNGAIVDSQFIYPSIDLGAPCSVNAVTGEVNCPQAQQHTQIERRNANTGMLLSTIQLLQTDPSLNLSSSALITLANGTQRKISYLTVEELFNKVSRLEPQQQTPEVEVPHRAVALAELSRVTGISTNNLESLIESIRYVQQAGHMEIVFKNNAMAEGRLIDPAGEFSKGFLPHRAILNFMEIGQAVGIDGSGWGSIYGVASMDWTWAETPESAGHFMTAHFDYRNESYPLTVEWYLNESQVSAGSAGGASMTLSTQSLLGWDRYTTMTRESAVILRSKPVSVVVDGQAVDASLKITLTKQADGNYYMTEHQVSPFAAEQAGIKTTLGYMFSVVDCMIGSPCPGPRLRGGYFERLDADGVRLSGGFISFISGTANVTLEGTEESVELQFTSMDNLLDLIHQLESAEHHTMLAPVLPEPEPEVLQKAEARTSVADFLNRKPFTPYVSPVLRRSEQKSERKIFGGLRPAESRKKKDAGRRKAEPKYEETVIRLQPLQIAGSAASDASLETWMSQMARGGVPNQEK